MILKFYKNMISFLLENEYNILSLNLNDNLINNESRLMSFHKLIGSSLTYVHLLRLDNLTQDLTNLTQSLEALCKLSAKAHNIRNSTSVFIFIGGEKDINENIIKMCENNTFNPTENEMLIKWIVNTDTCSLIIKGEQPKKINSLEKLIKKSFEAKPENIANVKHAINNTIEKRKKAIKSNNYFLTLLIFLINCLAFCLLKSEGEITTEILIKYGALAPDLVINNHEYYRLIISAFLHNSFSHLLSNNLSLIIFGSRVERYFGKLQFLLIYFLSTIFASTATILLNANIISVGASDCIFALIAALLVYTIFNKKSVAGLNLYTILLLVIASLSTGFMIPNVNNLAHISGFISGLIISTLILLHERKKENVK